MKYEYWVPSMAPTQYITAHERDLLLIVHCGDHYLRCILPAKNKCSVFHCRSVTNKNCRGSPCGFCQEQLYLARLLIIRIRAAPKMRGIREGFVSASVPCHSGSKKVSSNNLSRGAYCRNGQYSLSISCCIVSSFTYQLNTQFTTRPSGLSRSGWVRGTYLCFLPTAKASPIVGAIPLPSQHQWSFPEKFPFRLVKE